MRNNKEQMENHDSWASRRRHHADKEWGRRWDIERTLLYCNPSLLQNMQRAICCIIIRHLRKSARQKETYFVVNK